MKKASLYYSDLHMGGNSDKEYHVQIEPKGSGYVVNFQFGRRGGTLNDGTKTPLPLTLEDAERVFDRLVAEKETKGYLPNATSAPAAGVVRSDNAAQRTPFHVELLAEVNREHAETLVRDPKYIMQLKVDGHRCQIQKTSSGVAAYNKKGGIRALPNEVAAEADELAAKTFHMDGELISNSYVAFDLLELNGVNLTKLPYRERFESLVKLVDRIGHNFISSVPSWNTVGRKQWALADCFNNHSEGVCFKLANAPYRAAQSGQQFKFKFIKSATVKVTRVGVKSKNNARISMLRGKTWIEVGGVSLNGKGNVKVGDYLEVLFLYATASHQLFQGRMKELRVDADDSDCRIDQLKDSYKEGVEAA